MTMKNLNLKSHPEFSSGSTNNNALHTNGFRNKFGMTKSGEHGRSMVEMLGVLAVIGVLSIAGVSSYTAAMKKHRANELLNEASKRAVVLAMKVAAGQDIEHGLDEFGNNTVSGATFSSPSAPEGNTFSMSLTGVDEEICEQMKVMMGGDGMMHISDCTTSPVTLTFNKDLSKGVTPVSENTSTSISCTDGGNECSGCQICDTTTGKCKDNNASCPDNGTCTNGRCSDCPKGDACGTQCCADETYCAQSGSSYTCAAPSGSGCSKNSDCASAEKCEYGAGKCYCKIGGEDCSSPAKGTCEAKGNLTPVEYNGKTFYTRNDDLNWWAAENFCLAHGKKLASFTSLGLAKDYYYEDSTFDWLESTGENPGPLYTAFNAAGVGSRSFWTSTSKDSCQAWGIGVQAPYESVGHPDRDSFTNCPLCED